MATFSITFVAGLGSSNSAYPSMNSQQPAVQIDDTNATRGAQQLDMARNRQLNVLGSDGVIRKCTIDASRSDPSRNLIYYNLI
ncbi:MAG: hypothetical protein WAN65_21145 [Candidatus Sulfotelmatobacter sp.]